METEAKANVVASVWGPELDEFNLFFQIDQGKTASAARNLINSVPQTAATTFAFALSPSFNGKYIPK